MELVRGHGGIEGREFAFEGSHVNGRQFFTLRAGYQKEGKAFREVLIVHKLREVCPLPRQDSNFSFVEKNKFL